jgi:site-specific recombinase XerD
MAGREISPGATSAASRSSCPSSSVISSERASLLKRAGLSSMVRFHDLRHTCATLLLQQGVKPKFVQELLGHGDVSLTLSV